MTLADTFGIQTSKYFLISQNQSNLPITSFDTAVSKEAIILFVRWFLTSHSRWTCSFFGDGQVCYKTVLQLQFHSLSGLWNYRLKSHKAPVKPVGSILPCGDFVQIGKHRLKSHKAPVGRLEPMIFHFRKKQTL